MSVNAIEYDFDCIYGEGIPAYYKMPVPLMQGCVNAHQFNVRVVDRTDGIPQVCDLTGCTVTAKFMRSGLATINITGSVSDDGKEASVLIPNTCYADACNAQIAVYVSDSVTGVTQCVLRIDCVVKNAN